MKNFNLFLITCLVTLFSGQSYAQTWPIPKLEVTKLYDGSVYYVQNTGLDLYLGAGAAWNTQAILKENGTAVTAAIDEETNLTTLFFAPPSNALFRDDLNGNVFTDNTKDNKWNIQLKDAETLTYTIQAPSSYAGYKANQYLGTKGIKESTNNGDAYLVKYNFDKDIYSQYIEWRFINLSLYEARMDLYNALNNSKGTEVDVASYEEIYQNSMDHTQVSTAALRLNNVIAEYKAGKATPENPVDLTYLITNPSFESGTDGWINTGMGIQTNTAFPLKKGTAYLEKWVNMGSNVSNASIEQKLTGLPNGKYTLTVSGGNIQQRTPGSTLNTLTPPQTGAVLFAKTSNTTFTTPIDTIKTRSVDFLVLDNSVTIGLKAENATGNWLTCDNFQLQSKGMDVNEFVIWANESIEKAQGLLLKKMQNTVNQDLKSTITSVQNAVTTDPLVITSLNVAMTELMTAIENAKQSIKAYEDLQVEIDSAEKDYADGNGKEAAMLQTAIDEAKSVSADLDASLDALGEAVKDLNRTVFFFRLANGKGTAPKVTTNPNYARGATAAFGRSTVSGSNILERGFCWATHPEPTVLDNRTTKYHTRNGIIYHIENLEPATVYYMRAYALTKEYAVGYGDVIKVITIPKGNVTYTLGGNVIGSGDSYPRIAEAVRSAVEYYNNLTSIQGHHLSISYSAGTPTAEASYGGYLQFGASAGYQRTGTALHEMSHTVGVGQHGRWYELRAGNGFGPWLGDRANKVVQFFENNPAAAAEGDNMHMGPQDYGINGAGADSGSEILYIANVLIHQGLGEDGLPPTSNSGTATPAYTFESEDNVKYYIKNEATSRGRDDSFLKENKNGRLVCQKMTADEALSNDSAAWFFEFIPSTCYYQIKNAATGKYFTYRSGSPGSIVLSEKTAPASSENFQLMKARINTKIGSENTAFTTRGYWIFYPLKTTLTPPAFVANINRGTSAATFDFSNTATTQRWLLLSEKEVDLFKQALPTTALQEVTSSDVLVYGEKEQINIRNISTSSDITIFDVSGELQFTKNNVTGSFSQTLLPGVYIVSIRSAQYKDVRKVTVW